MKARQIDRAGNTMLLAILSHGHRARQECVLTPLAIRFATTPSGEDTFKREGRVLPLTFGLRKKRTEPVLHGSGSLLKVGSGGRIRTYDLRVMSPTSYQTAPPRDRWMRSIG